MLSYQEAYRKLRKEIGRDWRAIKIIQAIESINPNFYPVPVKGISGGNWNLVRSGFLSKNQFRDLYDRSSVILHSKNPFSKGPRYLSFDNNVPTYLTKIENLLNEHVVTLANLDESFHVILPSNQGKPIIVKHLTRRYF